ncbi:uncharacterized protein LOC129585360 [Paramacrobiotus metropolitanus]|uniref:uncharacterized protein LOC129585360 n=1 Tax=Paramacrobiotus metropolitanus TaxID=2943436 RepID=UPI0024462230|nr:uncharacterized protein LOC129585360 [Paramacrobiotus metropolitanus]XP_055333979.1 uncharacterized protein LOC129585360 [Paramacrobiotus metropolitanus]XP_055333980.1 uncharacterized protein LOC129585360 [Paramacrobiotus metropolitanus]
MENHDSFPENDERQAALARLEQAFSRLKAHTDERQQDKAAKNAEIQKLQATLLNKRQELKLLEEQAKKLEDCQTVEVVQKEAELAEETKALAELENQLNISSELVDLTQKCVRLECKFKDEEKPAEVTSAFLMRYSGKQNAFVPTRCVPMGLPYDAAQVGMLWQWLEEIVQKEEALEHKKDQHMDLLSTDVHMVE